MELTVIIVNYNVKFFLEQCLLSVQKAMQGKAGEIVVVDNASKDESRIYLQESFPAIRFFWNDENIGFAKANNLALKAAQGNYILFLNPDTIVPEDCFEKCITFMQLHPEAGALGVQMLDGSGQFLPESKRAFPSLLTALFRLSGLSRLFPKSSIFNRYHLGHLDQNKNHPVDVLAGAFMLTRKDVLIKTGSFDERFFMYAEDIDLSYRIRKAGYTNYYFSECSIIHFKGESTHKASLNYVKMFYHAMSLFVEKHYRGLHASVFRVFIHAAIWMRALLSMLKRLIRSTALPLLDAAIILACFEAAKIFWSNYVRTDVQYLDVLLRNSFIFFTILFLAIGYISGLYERKIKPRKLYYALLTALITLMIAYGLLPEQLRFSRGMVVLGALLSLGVLSIWRQLLLQLNVLEKAIPNEQLQTLVVGTEDDFQNMNYLLKSHRSKIALKGFVSPLNERAAMGNLQQLESILAGTPIQAVILCEGATLRFEEIIPLFKQLGRRVKLFVHAANSNSIVGSTERNESGEVMTGAIPYRLRESEQQRSKRLLDIGSALILLISFPIHFIMHPQPATLLMNALQVLLNRRTWIGYKTKAAHLPPLKPSVLNAAGLPHHSNSLPYDGQLLTDEWYAESFDLLQELKMLVKSYKKLGVKQH